MSFIFIISVLVQLSMWMRGGHGFLICISYCIGYRINRIFSENVKIFIGKQINSFFVISKANFD